jgi:hypothetical protein
LARLAGAGGTAGFGQDYRDVVVVRRFRAHELAGEVAGELEDLAGGESDVDPTPE